MTYQGSCHCGQVWFEVEGEVTQVMDCNCSICLRKGALLWFFPRDALRLLTPEEDLSTYTFGKHVIKHRSVPPAASTRSARAVMLRAGVGRRSTSVASKASISRPCPFSPSTAALADGHEIHQRSRGPAR